MVYFTNKIKHQRAIVMAGKDATEDAVVKAYLSLGGELIHEEEVKETVVSKAVKAVKKAVKKKK